MDFKQYKGKNILAWLWFDPDYYNPDKGNTVCYVYPRVLVNKFHYELIDPADFPKHGSIRVNINGGDTAEDLYERFGSFVSLKINEDDPYPNYDGNNMYSLRYNSSFGRTNSGIWIEKFSGKDFYQIIDVDSDISTLINTRSIPEPDCTIRTTLVLLRLNSKLYGPFEYDTTEGTMKLRGIKDYQYNIGEYSAVDYNDELLVITDQNDNEAVIIMPKSVLVSPEKSENRFDWISEETLIDSFIESMRVENSYTRDQIRQLKEMAHQLIERGSNVSFTKERISKIQSLMVGISQNEEYAQTMLQFALSDESTKEALVKELVSNHFDQIQNRITEFSAVQERLSELKSQEVSMEKHIQELQSEAENSKQPTSEDDQNKIDKLTKAIDDLQKENEGLAAIIGTQKEIEALRAERDSLKKERDIEREKRDQQLLDNKELEKQFNATLEAFNDQAKQTARILDSKLLDKILRGVGEEPATEEIAPFDCSLLHTDSMNCVDIIKRVTEFVHDKAHRDVTFNDVYCLLRLLKLLADNGYQKANVKEPVFKFDYVSADEHYQNEKDVANTYLLSNGEVTATLYYQPVISAVQFENDLTLFRTTKPPAGNPDYYTPDFVLKFASSEDDEEYAIFDAKFSSRANIKKHSLPEVIRKYSCEISAASRSSAPKMVWVLQGRVNGSENAIWKYHNSQLASTYRPITSFGIVSINTAVEIRQRLWNEIRSSISLLQ